MQKLTRRELFRRAAIGAAGLAVSTIVRPATTVFGRTKRASLLPFGMTSHKHGLYQFVDGGLTRLETTRGPLGDLVATPILDVPQPLTLFVGETDDWRRSVGWVEFEYVCPGDTVSSGRGRLSLA